MPRTTLTCSLRMNRNCNPSSSWTISLPSLCCLHPHWWGWSITWLVSRTFITSDHIRVWITADESRPHPLRSSLNHERDPDMLQLLQLRRFLIPNSREAILPFSYRFGGDLKCDLYHFWHWRVSILMITQMGLQLVFWVICNHLQQQRRQSASIVVCWQHFCA